MTPLTTLIGAALLIALGAYAGAAWIVYEIDKAADLARRINAEDEE